MSSITQLIHAVNNSEDDALNQLIVIAYERLHHSAKKALGYNKGMHSVQATELVNELYMHFKQQDQLTCVDSTHFFAIAALKLRQLLYDRLSKKQSKKRGGGKVETVSDVDDVPFEPPLLESIMLNKQLESLRKIDEKAAMVVDLLTFWEFNSKEASEILGISESTVHRKWKWAKAWLATKGKS